MLARLRPIFALFLRAVREDSRAKFPPILRTLAVLGLLCIFGFSDRYRDLGGPAGLLLLEDVTDLNLVGILLLGLATFGSAITEEKEDGTLELLRLTRLNPLAILLGKSGARLLAGLLFLAAQIPFVMLCIALGGVTLEQILRIYTVLAACLVFLCGLGLFFSVVCRRAFTAIASIVLVCVALCVLAALDAGFESFNPAFDLSETLALSSAGASAATRVHDSLPFLLAGGAACFGLAWLCFDRFCGRDPQAAAARARKSRPPRRAIGPALFWKEYAFAIGGAHGLALRFGLYLGIITITAALAFQNRQGGFETTFVDLMVFYGWIGFSLEFGLAASAVFGKERRDYTLETLLVVPGSVPRLVWQKIAGHLVSVLPGALCLVVGRSLQYESAPTMARFLGLYDLVWLDAAGLFIFAFALIVYLSLRLRRGALLAGLIFAVCWIFFHQALSNHNFSDAGEIYAALRIFTPCGLILVATFLFLAIPRHLVRCGGES